MRKLALLLAAILTLNLAAPAASVYAAPAETVVETIADEVESTDETTEEVVEVVAETTSEMSEEVVETTVADTETEGDVETSETESEAATESETANETEVPEESTIETTVELVTEEVYNQEIMAEAVEEGGDEGATESPESDFEWSGTTITKYIGTDTKVVIPKKTTVIGDNAFKENKQIQSVTITENVTELGYWAFYGCSNLSEVKIETTKIGRNGCSDNVFYGCSISSVEFPENITYIPAKLFYNGGFTTGTTVEIPASVTEIGAHAFQGAGNITGIVFAGDKVTTIDSFAFAGTGIDSIELPEKLEVISQQMFYECKKLKEIVIPENVTELGYWAFYGCSDLSDVKIETTKIGRNGCSDNVFYGCSISSVEFPENITYIPAKLFYNGGFTTGTTVEIPASVTEIGARAFQGAGNITGIVFAGDKVTTIDSFAFAGTGIDSIELPEKLKVISQQMFYECKKLKEIVIPENVTELGYWAFYGCSDLSDVKIETTKIGRNGCGDNVFYGCSISSVEFPENITYIPAKLFYNGGFTTGTTVEIPASVTEIGARAFQGAGNITGIVFAGDKVTTIDSFAFAGTGIDSIDLPEKLKVISQQMFYECKKLKEIVIPENVTELGYWAFMGCDSLEKMVLPANIKKFGSNAIPKNSYLKIYAPKDSASYKWAKKNGYNVAEIYTIKYKLNGGVNGEGNPTYYELGDSLTFKDPTKNGFEFVGWYKDSELKKPFTYTETTKGNLTLHAKWKTITYAIIYETNGGELAKKSPVSYKITAETALKKPVKTGYTFTGWYTTEKLTAESKITKIKKGSTGEIKLYAGWTANIYKIKFAKNAKNVTGTMDVITGVVYDTPVTLTGNVFARKGYTFAGWNTKANGKGTAIADGANVSNLATQNNGVVTLYAVWKAIPYAITYHLNDGNNHAKNPPTYTVAQGIIFKKPARTGYTFKGWYTDAEFTKKITQIKAGSIGNVEVYAKWQVNKYTVKFNANKGKGKMTELKNCEYDKTYELPDNVFIRNGYKFIGWNTKANGSGVSYENMAEIEKLTSVNGGTVTLYAQWEKN